VSDSVSHQLLLDCLARCVEERFAIDALDGLCDALELALHSGAGTHTELIEALANYGHQLHAGAIQLSDETTALFREAQAILSEDGTSRQGISIDDRATRLLERIDLEASGGFDAFEAGEVSAVDVSATSNYEVVQLRNTIHRLHASLDTLERYASSTGVGKPLADVLSRHRQLLDSLTTTSPGSQVVPLMTVEEMLGLQLGGTHVNVNVEGEGSVHATYAPILTSLVTHLTASFDATTNRTVTIKPNQDVIEIELTLEMDQASLTGLRAKAIERDFLRVHAPLRDGDELQYVLLPDTCEAGECLVQSSALFDHFNALGANVAIDSPDKTIRVCAELAANVRLESVTVFQIDGATYAILTNSINDIDYTRSVNDTTFKQTTESTGKTLHLKGLGPSKTNCEVSLLIEDDDGSGALFVDQIESPGQLVVGDTFDATIHVGGSVRLLDRRLVVLISGDDLAESRQPSRSAEPDAMLRLLALGDVIFASQVNRHVSQVSFADGDMVAMSTLQEQRPHAIYLEHRDLSTYTDVLSSAQQLHVPLIVRTCGELSATVDDRGLEYESIKTLTELESKLLSLTTDEDKKPRQ